MTYSVFSGTLNPTQSINLAGFFAMLLSAVDIVAFVLRGTSCNWDVAYAVTDYCTALQSPWASCSQMFTDCFECHDPRSL